ncbi:MAG: histidine phosphatase family protein [Candidatus Rokubacteria bacterium]|nr:histidine phosphatase family protein [Candidatus Rokubacteria bacterium]
MATLRLLVIRHGSTDSNRERRFTGWRDVPLSDVGRQEAEAVARALAGQPVAAVYASPLQRARVTAEIVAAAHRLTVTPLPDFREMSFGDWEGLTVSEVQACFPEDFARWRGTAPQQVLRPGGESMAEVAKRVGRGLAEIRAGHPEQTVVLVTHAVVTRLLVLSALGLEPDRYWSVDVSPAGITEIEYRDDWTTLHRLNTLAHLESPPPSREPAREDHTTEATRATVRPPTPRAGLADPATSEP